MEAVSSVLTVTKRMIPQVELCQMTMTQVKSTKTMSMSAQLSGTILSTMVTRAMTSTRTVTV